MIEMQIGNTWVILEENVEDMAAALEMWEYLLPGSVLRCR